MQWVPIVLESRALSIALAGISWKKSEAKGGGTQCTLDLLSIQNCVIKKGRPQELFELFETIPFVQCSECLLYRNQGIVYCTCRHLLRENQSSRGTFRWTLDLLSIPNNVIKKVRPHGNRHGKTQEQINHFFAHNFRKSCIKKIFLKEFTIASRKIQISWLATQNWSNWRNMHPDGRGGAERFNLSPIVRRVWEILKKNWSPSQHIWTQCTDETPIRLQRSIHKNCTVFTLSLEKSDFPPILSWQY